VQEAKPPIGGLASCTSRAFENYGEFLEKNAEYFKDKKALEKYLLE
jgi:hypothetical protein